MSRPGAAMSILPKFENGDGARFGSSDATDMIVGEFAGAPTGPPLEPDGATMMHPRLRAACPAAVYAADTGVGDPIATRIATHRFAMAQFNPASTVAVVVEPELPTILPTKIGARYPIPYRGVAPGGAFGPHAVPIRCVP